MSVLKKDRRPTVTDALHDCIKIRQEVTELTLRDFLYSGRALAERPKNYKEMSQAEKSGWDRAAQVAKSTAEKFDLWYIQDERSTIIGMCRDLVKELSIGEYYKESIENLRAKCQGICSAIKHELQYVYETIPANNNVSLAIVSEIEQMIEDLNRLHFD